MGYVTHLTRMTHRHPDVYLTTMCIVCRTYVMATNSYRRTFIYGEMYVRSTTTNSYSCVWVRVCVYVCVCACVLLLHLLGAY